MVGDLAPLDKAPTVVVGTGAVDRDTVLGLVGGLHVLGAEEHRLLCLQVLPWLLLAVIMLSSFVYVTGVTAHWTGSGSGVTACCLANAREAVGSFTKACRHG